MTIALALQGEVDEPQTEKWLPKSIELVQWSSDNLLQKLAGR